MLLVGVLLIPSFYAYYAYAAETPKDDYGLGKTAAQAYLGDNGDVKKLKADPREITGAVVGVVLAALGVMFMLQIIIGGIRWLSAAGNEEKVTAAKGTITHALIGLVIVIGAYALVNYVLQGLLSSVFK